MLRTLLKHRLQSIRALSPVTPPVSASSLFAKLVVLRPRRARSDSRFEAELKAEKRKALTYVAATAVVGSALYVANDYVDAKKGIKKNKQPTGLNHFYIKMAQNDEQRRQFGIVPAELFQKGKGMFLNKDSDSGIKYFEKMLLVHPTAEELPLYKEIENILFQSHYIKEDILLKLWNLIEVSDNMPAKFNKLAEAYFNEGLFDQALAYWKIAELKDLPEKYAAIAQAHFNKKDFQNALQNWETALSNGCQSFDMLMKMGHIYLIQPKCEHLRAEHLFKAALELKSENNPHITVRNAAIAANELGVTNFVNAALHARTPDFNKIRQEAIGYFEEALSLSPDDPVIQLNFEIAKSLNEYPHYGEPHRLLQCQVDQPTSMFEAIRTTLIANRTETVNESGSGLGFTPTYNDKGSYTGMSPVIVSTSSSHTIPRIHNELALDKLSTIERQHEARLHEKMKLSVSASSLRKP